MEILIFKKIVCLLYRIYKKYKGKTVPNHLFQINLLITFLLQILFWIFNVLYNISTDMASSFCPHYWFGLFIFMSNNTDILLIQLDRFVAVFWSLEYPGFATNTRAICACLVAKPSQQHLHYARYSWTMTT